MELVVKEFSELSLDELYRVLKLRVDVFVVEQHCAYEEIDNLDQRATHVMLLDDNKQLAAYARVFEKSDEPGVAKIGRIISVQRKAGLGRELLEHCFELCKEKFGAREAYIEAQVQAQGFYEKLGFVQWSEPFDDAGILHIEMRRPLGDVAS